jgi:hypothetical protein
MKTMRQDAMTSTSPTVEYEEALLAAMYHIHQ